MKYQIFGGSFPAAEVYLNANEEVVARSGAMAWCDSSVTMCTSMEGGFLKGLGRVFSGASLMLVRHKATTDNSKVSFAASTPGEIREFCIDSDHEYIAQKSAFLVGDETVNIKTIVSKKIMTGLFGGEGFVMQRFCNKGIVLAQFAGSVKEIELQEDETIKVESGHVAAFDAKVTYSIQSVKGFKNILFSGQGLFMATLKGPGKVWLQTLTESDIGQNQSLRMSTNISSSVPVSSK